MRHFWVPWVVALVGHILIAGLGQAQTLTIALQREPTSMDPHYQASMPNMQLAMTLFDPLVRTNSQAVSEPALAHSWEVEGNQWTFYLRPNVHFSNGVLLTADDVLFSLSRPYKIQYSPSSYVVYLNQIKELRRLDEHTIQITTHQPAPTLLADLAMIPIISQQTARKMAGANVYQAPLNPEALVGTGPFKLLSWQQGDAITLERNTHYWGAQVAWEQVTFKPMTSGADRVQALVTKQVDLIEAPPIDEIPHLEKMPTVFVQKKPSTRVMYIALNQARAVPGGFQTATETNPLTDHRVRTALSLAIDRTYLARNVMNGAAVPAGNLLSHPAFGVSQELAVAPALQFERALELLHAAGYAQGFKVTLGAPVGLYQNDAGVAQAIADMWSLLGLEVEVLLETPEIFFKLRDQYVFGSYLSAWNASSGEMSQSLKALAMTPDHHLGYGIMNWSHYSNAHLDQLVTQALQTLDADLRQHLLQQAAQELIQDRVVIPILFELSTWAMRHGLRYEGRADQHTLPQYIYPL